MTFFSENRIAPETKVASDNTANLQAGLVNTNLSVSPTINGGNFSLCSCGRTINRDELVEEENDMDVHQTYVSDPSIDIMFICGEAKSRIKWSVVEKIRLNIGAFARQHGAYKDLSHENLKSFLNGVGDRSQVFVFANTFVWLTNKVVLKTLKEMKTSRGKEKKLHNQVEEYFSNKHVQHTFVIALGLSFTGINETELRSSINYFDKAFPIREGMMNMFNEYMEDPVAFNYQIAINLLTGLPRNCFTSEEESKEAERRRLNMWTRVSKSKESPALIIGKDTRVDLIKGMVAMDVFFLGMVDVEEALGKTSSQA